MAAGLDELHVWLAPASSGGDWLQQMGQPLPFRLQHRLERFTQPHERNLRAAALALLCTALQKLDNIAPAATLAALCHEPSGCPRLRFNPSFFPSSLSSSPPAPRDATPWHLSFSYAPDWAVCALRRLPDAAPLLGVDGESAPLKGSPEHFAAFFTPAEQRAIADAADSEDERVRLWTCKEALLKALGTGFSCDPHVIATTHNPVCATLPLISAEASFPSRQLPLHCIRLTNPAHSRSGVHSLFWQSIPLAPHSWLTVASFPAWEKTRISFLRPA